jgi:hypothetical protein
MIKKIAIQINRVGRVIVHSRWRHCEGLPRSNPNNKCCLMNYRFIPEQSRLTRLFNDIGDAIVREKSIKAKSRIQKQEIKLHESLNSEYEGLWNK